MKHAFLLMAILSVSVVHAEDKPLKVLFVGNSLTGTNDLHGTKPHGSP